MRHDIYEDVTYRKVTVSVGGQAVTVRGWILGEFVAVAGGGGFGWKVHRLHPDRSNVSTELVRGLDRDVAISIVHAAARAGCTKLEELQGILRTHLGGFAL